MLSGRRFTMHQRAAPGERFAPNAWDKVIGQEVSVRLPDDSTRTGKLVAAKVVEKGYAVDLTIELPENPPIEFNWQSPPDNDTGSE